VSPDGTIRVFVSSRKVPARRIAIHRPVYSPSGVVLGTQTNYSVVYEKELADSHQRVIEEAKKLSCNLGLTLEVIDRSISSPFRRLISTITGGRTPQLVLSFNPSDSAAACC